MQNLKIKENEVKNDYILFFFHIQQKIIPISSYKQKIIQF